MVDRWSRVVGLGCMVGLAACGAFHVQTWSSSGSGNPSESSAEAPAQPSGGAAPPGLTALCERPRPADLARKAIVGAACEPDSDRSAQQALHALYLGSTSSLPAAVLAGNCPAAYDPETEYFTWRECRSYVEGIDLARLAAELDQIGDAYLKERTLTLVRAAKQEVADAAAAMAEHEGAYPGSKLIYDDAVAEVEAGYGKLLATFRPRLAAVEAWEAKVAQGARFAGTCRDDLTKLLQDYVHAVLPRPSKERLMAVLSDPVALPVSQALVGCYRALGEERDASNLLRALRGDHLQRGHHYALVGAIARLASGDGGKYKGKRRAPSFRVMGPTEDEASNLHDLGADDLSQLHPAESAVVGTVTRQGDHVLVRFKRETSVSYHMEDCKRTGGIDHIDADGSVHYAEHCKEVRDSSDVTKAPVLVPVAQSARVTPGVRVGFDADLPEPEKGPRTVNLIWVHDKADHLIWLLGLSAGS